MVSVGGVVVGVVEIDDGEDFKCASVGNVRTVWVPNAQIGIRANMKIVHLP